MNTPQQALQEIKNGKVWPIYYLHGDEPYKVQEFIQKMRDLVQGKDSNKSFDVQKLDGASCTGEDIMDSLQSLSLFSSLGGGSKKIVFVQNAQALKSVDSFFEKLQSMKKEDGAWDGSVLICIAEGLDGRKKFHQWLKKSGYALEFKRAQGTELAQWLNYMAKKCNVKLAKEAFDLLLVASDGSLQRLDQELQKAWLYAGGNDGAHIQADEVSAVAASQVTHEMIEFVESILQKKKTKALLLVDKLIQNPEDALGLVGFLTWAVKNPGRIQMSRGTPVTELVQRLVELDYKLKRSGMDAKLLIENFILQACHS